MSIYSGDEDCGDEITSPDCEVLDVPCFDRERLRCPGCGGAFGSGCSCRANARAIGKGEAAKCRAEEPWCE